MKGVEDIRGYVREKNGNHEAARNLGQLWISCFPACPAAAALLGSRCDVTMLGASTLPSTQSSSLSLTLKSQSHFSELSRRFS